MTLEVPLERVLLFLLVHALELAGTFFAILAPFVARPAAPF